MKGITKFWFWTRVRNLGESFDEIPEFRMVKNNTFFVSVYHVVHLSVVRMSVFCASRQCGWCCNKMLPRTTS